MLTDAIDDSSLEIFHNNTLLSAYITYITYISWTDSNN